MTHETKVLPRDPVGQAPDGSEVRLLCNVSRGSMAHFQLPPGAVSRSVVHATVEEIWYFLSGRGRMWRRSGPVEDVVEVAAGTCVTIPIGTHFQFRADGDEPLAAVGVTMPPWPGEQEAQPVLGKWEPTGVV